MWSALILYITMSTTLSFHRSFPARYGAALMAKKEWQPPVAEIPGDEGNGVSFEIELPKRAGISWGSDLSFSWVYVLDVEPTGEAAASGMVQKGDYIIGMGNTSCIGKDFDFVLSTYNSQPSIFNYTFFRGTKEQLLGGPVPAPEETTVTVTVKQAGKPDITLDCPGGTNLRRLLVGNGINVYRSLTRWTNCNGQQRCGTCIVDVGREGLENCSRKALDEQAVLAENDEGYRLSCRTEVYGDVTVEVQGPVGAAQWTR
jgi:ferredoxin